MKSGGAAAALQMIPGDPSQNNRSETRAETIRISSAEATMLTLISLLMLVIGGAICFVAVAAAVAFTKVLVHVVFWPLKILLLPFLLLAVIIKLAIIIAVVGVIAAVLIPLAILAVLFAAPFLVAAAFT